jgi:hypothetical protein
MRSARHGYSGYGNLDVLRSGLQLGKLPRQALRSWSAVTLVAVLGSRSARTDITFKSLAQLLSACLALLAADDGVALNFDLGLGNGQTSNGD